MKISVIPQKPRWFRILWIVTFVNFAVFWIISQILGGNAIAGHVTDGQFFLTKGSIDTQVSEAVYAYSVIHTRLTYILMPITLILWGPIAFLNWQMNKR